MWDDHHSFFNECKKILLLKGVSQSGHRHAQSFHCCTINSSLIGGQGFNNSRVSRSSWVYCLVRTNLIRNRSLLSVHDDGLTYIILEGNITICFYTHDLNENSKRRRRRRRKSKVKIEHEEKKKITALTIQKCASRSINEKRKKHINSLKTFDCWC